MIYLSHIFLDMLMEHLAEIYMLDFGLLFPILSFGVSLIGSILIYWLVKMLLKDKSYYVIGAS